MDNLSDIEILTIEITIRKSKILVAGIYKLPNLSETDFTTSLEIIISKLSNSYEKLILMGDFNMTTSNPILSQFLDTLALSPLIQLVLRIKKIQVVSIFCSQISNLALCKQTFLELVSLVIVK